MIKESVESSTKKVAQRRIMSGVVVRKSGDKTVAVAVTRVKVHRLYGKRQTTTKIYLAHDPDNSAKTGSTVKIRSCRPLSRRKHWLVVAE